MRIYDDIYEVYRPCVIYNAIKEFIDFILVNRYAKSGKNCIGSSQEFQAMILVRMIFDQNLE